MKSKSPGYQPGNHWGICDICGFAYRNSQLKKTWDNKVVCDADFEVRHPQDFVRSKEDDQSPKGLVRTEPADVFITNNFPTDGCTDLTSTAGDAVAGCLTAGA